jgi:hypothetical protein
MKNLSKTHKTISFQVHYFVRKKLHVLKNSKINFEVYYNNIE